MTISLVFCLISVGVLGICMIFILYQYRRLRMQCEAQQHSIANLEQLNYELRAARHDHLNHLQVVCGMLELEEYQELKEYIRPVYKDIMKTGKALKTSKPALNALLKAKMEEAESKQIDVYVEVKSDLKLLRVEDWQLCKVLSNLLDNAVTALQEAGRAEVSQGETSAEKKIEIDINETRDAYIFTVSNNGPPIAEDMIPLIFKRGFTTKKEEGHGMGLAIVVDVLRESRGRVAVKSDGKGTAFTVTFQKGEVSKEKEE